MPSITVGMPTGGAVKAQTAFSLVGACLDLQTVVTGLHFCWREGAYIGWNRDALVRDALEARTDYLMMIDSDLVFPADGIARLLGRGKDIIGGYYMLRSLPLTNTIRLDDGKGGFRPAENFMPPDEPFRVAAVATGFMLVHTNVFKKMTAPWFPCVEPVGEDIAFCQNALKAGFEVWCDPTFPISHIGDYLY